MGFIYLFFLSCFVFHFSNAQEECVNATCPEPLDCRYPKVVVQLPDPYNKCCNITECICEGSSSRLSASHNPQAQYELFSRYENCTMIDGNLEIVFISSKRNTKILDVTKHIRSVTGYVLIAMTTIDYIDLSSLRLIRGQTLYDESQSKDETCSKQTTDATSGYGFYVFSNQDTNDPEVGLKGILMPSLTEIMKGDVKIHTNRNLCFVDTIIWDKEILNDKNQKAYVDTNKDLKCPKCPSSCVHKDVDDNAHCWGEAAELCQQFTRIPCDSVCTQRCNRRGQCCESFCAGGCIEENEGMTRECHACIFFNDFGKCLQRCPSGSKITGSTEVVANVDNLKKRYELVWYCVPECPSTRRVYEPEKRCVLTCPVNFYSKNGKCERCPGDKCHNICYGLDAKLGPLQNDDIIHAGNVGNFTKNCTIIEGSLKFRKQSFQGDQHCKIPALLADKFDVFQNVEEITGYLSIEWWPYENICIFKNLKRIRGYEKFQTAYSLTVMTDMKRLRSLCFNSLQQIEFGRVLVYRNPGLCNTKDINWDKLFPRHESSQKQVVLMNAKKRNCLPCHKFCGSDGCWGSESTQCVSCKYYTDYTDVEGHYADKWVIDETSNKPVPGHNVTNCVKECNVSKGVFASLDKRCLPCDKECNSTCHGAGPTKCFVQPRSGFSHGCKNVNYNGTCMAKCPISHYPDAFKECQSCSIGCIGGCDGPEDSTGKGGCSDCYKSYDTDKNIVLYDGRKCDICPDDQCVDGCTLNNQTGVFACYYPPSNAYIAYIVVAVIVIIIVSVVLFVFWKRGKTISLMRKHIGEKMVGDGARVDEFDSPLTPSGAAPNQSKLRIVKEDELVLGKTLGSGAFGAVYKGVWTSLHIEGQTIKIAVAVKQLKAFSHNNEILDEAHVMASVDNPYLIRLLGICMTEQVSLITQLMPLGSLLGYVRDHGDKISSRHMLTWCAQIAKGMQYLEEKHLVHRDLAARNVLIKSPYHVKITDFGLSKMLNVTESVYLAEGGKLPIKWLAIECITERKFSHQSDVWAFGVTCWEIFTFGAKPYFGEAAVDVLSLLERGERLTQPSVCTIDVYMLLLKCWIFEPVCRPRFSELVDEFTKMSHDHTRYLVIKNDPNPGLTSPDPEEEKRFFERLIKEESEDVDGDLIIDEPDSYLLRQDEPHHSYTYMSPTESSVSESVEQDFHEYENQATLDQMQGIPTVNGGSSSSVGNGNSSRSARLFSRNTPSARLPSPGSNTNPGTLSGGAACSLPRVSDSSNPDDVFANSGHSFRNQGPSKSMVVDLPAPDGKGADDIPVRYRPSQGQPWSSSVRKDSEENPRYTEDPTTHNRSSYIDPLLSPSTVDHEVLLSANEEQNKLLYDEEEYLLPTPTPNAVPVTNSDYFDPSKPYSKKKSSKETEPKSIRETNGFRASLSNGTYVESGEARPLLTTQSPPWNPDSYDRQQRPRFLDDDGPEYVNSQPEHEYLNWDPHKGDAMMSDVINNGNNSLNRSSGERSISRTHSGRNPDEATFYNNEEYMATDSGIGEDNQSVLSASNGMHHPLGASQNRPSRNRQNSSLSSGGDSNGSLGPLIGGSPIHHPRLSSDEHQMSLDRTGVRYKPVPKPRQSVKRTPNLPNNNFGLDNPEYMMLQESVSDTKGMLGENESSA